ncbi:hypothetical protein B9Z55_019930 [Caenorhabditis nigoni]|uniref:G-protein coupled receptors family 1 profile domain-containing protein n=3 Tax=Caenorhabditis nigoni TaxID=1611254 RepID=A0A2G5TKF4_9PELO|nr:hypothetical protein B9Z55_019930 [Caenorhabditis nigoni]
MASELNCTQFTEPWPDPGTPGADDITIPWLINTVVKAYNPYHYYLLTSMVTFSFISNILIAIVLSRKEMRSSGTNVTMFFISICDFGCAVAGLIQVFVKNYSIKYSLAGIVLLHMTVDYLTVLLHASSLFLAVSLAFCRVMALKISNKNRSQWQSPKYAVRMAVGLCSPVVVSASSILFMNSVQEDEEEGVHLQISDLSLANGCLYMKLILLNGDSPLLLYVGVVFDTVKTDG